jgi:hypothetical protein
LKSRQCPIQHGPVLIENGWVATHLRTVHRNALPKRLVLIRRHVDALL